MKIRLNKENQIEVQLEPKCKYRLLFHRIAFGRYQQYVKLGKKEYILNDEELKEIKKFIESIEVKDNG